MRTRLVAGNWKMHGGRSANAALLDALLPGIAALDAVDTAVCVPYPYLGEVGGQLAGSSLRLGAQNVSEFAAGAYTGEVSASMLAEFGCAYVLVGHSERRALYGETDAQVAEKFSAVQAAGLTPILCVGESLEERASGHTEQVVGRQLDAVLKSGGSEAAQALENAVLAYEPVWAIGSGLTASPQQAQDVHAFLRDRIAGVSKNVAAKVRILYGGSVKPANAGLIFAMNDVDGGLIGGASLVADDFLAICKAAASKR